jgi:hypothetical protein
VVGYADANRNGLLEPDEVVLGDTAVYVGSTLPEYTATLHTVVSLFRGALSVSAGLLYEAGMSQENGARIMGAFSRGFNDPAFSAISLEEQLLSGRVVGHSTAAQTVNSLRLNSLSVTYQPPTAVVRRLGAKALSVSLQGTNLGLWTNYLGVDPNVNASVVGKNVSDPGVLPRPRAWQIRVSATY